MKQEIKKFSQLNVKKESFFKEMRLQEYKWQELKPMKQHMK